MLRGISNFQIKNVIKNINDEHLLKNFVGVFPSNRMIRLTYQLIEVFAKIILGFYIIVVFYSKEKEEK